MGFSRLERSLSCDLTYLSGEAVVAPGLLVADKGVSCTTQEIPAPRLRLSIFKSEPTVLN